MKWMGLCTEAVVFPFVDFNAIHLVRVICTIVLWYQFWKKVRGGENETWDDNAVGLQGILLVKIIESWWGWC